MRSLWGKCGLSKKEEQVILGKQSRAIRSSSHSSRFPSPQERTLGLKTVLFGFWMPEGQKDRQQKTGPCTTMAMFGFFYSKQKPRFLNWVEFLPIQEKGPSLAKIQGVMALCLSCLDLYTTSFQGTNEKQHHRVLIQTNKIHLNKPS